MKKVLSILLCAILVVTMFTGCSKSQSQENSGDEANSSTPVKTDLVFGITSEPKSLTPYKMDDFTAFSLSYQIYNSLIELKSDGTLVPSLATSWEYENDGKDLVFHLREGVKFHNGEEMTSEDVAWSYNQAIKTPTTANSTSTFERMEVIDKYTVRLVQKQVFGPVESVIPFAHLRIVCKAADEADPDGFARNPIGTGPYKFVSWDIGDKITLKAFDEYWEGEPTIKDLTFKICLDTNTALVALENGEIDICDTIPNTQKETVESGGKLKWVTTPQAATYFLQLNTSNKPFDNKLVRQAIACAIDKESLVIGSLNGEGSVIEAMMSPSVGNYPKDFKSEFQYDPDRAKELLKEAGLPDGFKVEFSVMDDTRMLPAAEMIQEMLRQVGIDAYIEKYERGVWLEKVRNTHKYDMTLMNTSPVYPDGDYLFPLYHSSFIPKMKNWGEVNDPELDALLEEGRSCTDEQQRKEIYRKVVEVMDKNMYAPPVYVPNQPYVINKDLKNVVPSSTRRLFVFDYSW